MLMREHVASVKASLIRSLAERSADVATDAGSAGPFAGQTATRPRKH
jgi:hypothetical protein